MTIRIQVTGGLGNQLFIWAGAHELQKRFASRVELIHIMDKNSRTDRDIELWEISKLCKHGISIKVWRKLGLVFRVIDKFQLEKNAPIAAALQRLGIYSFSDPVSRMIFEKGKPRLVRCYFQRTDIVESSWEYWSDEILETIDKIDISELRVTENYTAVHIRRGDSLSSADTFGVLPLTYFQTKSEKIGTKYLCTDDIELPSKFKEQVDPINIFSPLDSDVWQTLKVFYNSKSFIGANSTLSWWAAYLRFQKGNLSSVLPFPWTRQELGFDDALRVPGITYRDAGFDDES